MNKIFDIKGLADEKSASLLFTCSSCNKVASSDAAKSPCSCGSNLYKVARYMNLINYPKTPYHTDEEEDGPKLTTPGDISTSVGGNENYDIPKDGAEGEEFGTPGANSDDLLLPEHMHDVNIKHNTPKGVHNMNPNSIFKSPENVFERTRRHLWPHVEERKA